MKSERNILSKFKKTARLVRYTWGGLITTIIGFLVIFTSMKFGLSPFVSNAVGYGVGLILSFMISKNFVFKSDGHLVIESIRYLTAFVISFLVNLFVLHTSLINFMLPMLASQILAALSYTLLMYLFMCVFVFNPAINIKLTEIKKK